MGTRSLTVINSEWDDSEICVLYRQYDGYPEGHGKDLLDFLRGMSVVNGMGLDDRERISNGMDCLAAQIVAHFKNGPGYFYLNAAGTRDVCEEFIYTLYIYNKDKLSIKVEDTYDKGHILFDGSLDEYEQWINKSHKIEPAVNESDVSSAIETALS
jgi:hypothetical protein